MPLEITVATDPTRRANVIHLVNPLAEYPSVALVSFADLSEYGGPSSVATSLGTYGVDPEGTFVLDFTPPLGVPVYYRATAGSTVVRSIPAVHGHGQYVWVKSKEYADRPIGLLLKAAPNFSFNAEVNVFYGLSSATQGLGYGQAGVRRPGAVEFSFYTWSFEEASRVRDLIRDNPLCVQWPGVTDEPLMVAPWYLLENVSRTAIGPPDQGMFEWTWTMSPVHATTRVFAEVSATYQTVYTGGWDSYMDMDADPDVVTYTHAQMAAVADGGPPLPEGESGVRVGYS
ncbi:hypothetical protein [Glycomyces sp. NPDC048151]|uniref:hypothetical protein n=1 Tax=Glycomyces sp. NPDC048151 TaxID=3364002 RepID=UPI00371B14D4